MFYFAFKRIFKMSTFHDEVEIEDMEYDEESETYFYPCPCGDKFQISKVIILSALR
jgi:diphthamide biosynthesis protein 3